MFVRKLISHLNCVRSINYSACINNFENKTAPKDIKSLLDNSASYEEKNPPEDSWITSPYPHKIRQQAVLPSVDPKTTSVILFPGQGTQYVGMAKSLIQYPNVVDMFDAASDILRYNLLDLCIHGPHDMLNMTVHCQVAIMVCSLAAVEKLRAQNVKMIENCAATAGFSVGEYAALVFAGALEFEHAVRLLKIRGEAMQAASDLQSSGMMTCFISHQAKINYACKCAREWCEQQGIENPECRVAIYLYPQCRVVSGHMEALKYLELNGTEYGIEKVKYIPVSGAFHSKLMLPAKSVLQKALKTTAIEKALIPVFSNVDGKPYVTVDHIRTKLANQLVEPVKWEQTMHAIFQRERGKEFPWTFECGPGTTLKTLVRWNNNEAYKQCTSILA